MTESITELGHAPMPPTEVRQTPVATPAVIPAITLLSGEPVSFDPTRDNVGPPIFVLPEKPASAGELRLAEIVVPERWKTLSALTKSDMTPEEAEAFVTTLLTTPVLDGVQITEWSKDDWRVSRHYADFAYTIAHYPLDPGLMRIPQAGFAQHLGRFVDGFPEGEEDMRELFGAIYRLGISADWRNKPNLGREIDNAFWDVGERVLESWTAQPVRQN